VVVAVVVVIADAVTQLVGPYLTKEAIDNGIRHRDLGHLDRVAALYLGVLAVSFGLGYLQTQIMQRVGQHIMVDLRRALFARLQRLPIAYFDRHPVGRLLTRVTNDVDVLNELFTAGVVAIFGDLFTLVGILFAMGRLNAELMLVAFSVLPLIVIVTLTFRAKVRRTFREIRTRLARLNAFLNETVTGMTTVQLMNREAKNAAEFGAANAGHRDANLTAVRYYSIFFPALELVGAIAVSLIVWYGGRQVMWTGITLGTLVAFIQYTQRFFRPISDLSEKYNILQQAMASSERIFDLLDAPVDPAAPAMESERGAGVPAAAAPRPRDRRRSAAVEPAPARPPTATRRAGCRAAAASPSITCGLRTEGKTGSCATFRSRSPPASAWRSSARPARVRRRSPRCCCVSTIRSVARSASTVATCGRGMRRCCAGAWDSCSRTCSCSRARSPAISGSATPSCPSNACSARRATSASTSSSAPCRGATTLRSASVGPRSRSDKSSCSRSLGRLPTTRRS
jgi:ABC-type multidrug transport system fused ATPase/permease subunit